MKQRKYPFPRYERPTQANNTPDAKRTLRNLAELSKASGVTVPGIQEALKKVEHAGDIKAKATEYGIEPGQFQRRIAAQLADGSMTLDEAATEAAKNQALQRNGIVWKAAMNTESIAVKQIFRQLESDIDGPALEAEIKKVAEATLAEIHSLRDTLDGIRDGDQAVAAGAAQTKAWSRYVNELMPRFDACHDLARILRDHHYVAPIPRMPNDAKATANPRFLNSREARADLVHARKNGLPEPLLGLDPITDNWEPGFWTETEITQRLEAEGFTRTSEPSIA